MAVDALRVRALDEARSWIGTPYRHQASCKGAGADCLGLIRGVWRALYGVEPETPPPYTPDWSEAGREERLLGAARRRLVELPLRGAAPGDVLLLRMRKDGPAKHLGLLGAPLDAGPTVIHAYTGHGVHESRLGDAWLRRVVATFRFPNEAS